MNPRQTLGHLRKAQQALYEAQAIAAGIGALLDDAMPLDEFSGPRVAHADTMAGAIDGYLSRALADLEEVEAAATRAVRGTEA